MKALGMIETRGLVLEGSLIQFFGQCFIGELHRGCKARYGKNPIKRQVLLFDTLHRYVLILQFCHRIKCF